MMNLEKWLTVSIAIAFGLVLCGCSRSPEPQIKGGSPPQAETTSLASENDAIRRFQAVRSSIRFSPLPDERVHARRDLLRNCLARVNDTLRPQDKEHGIVFGNLSALDRDGECWVVEIDQGMLGGQVAYFDDAGELVLAWRVPEG